MAGLVLGVLLIATESAQACAVCGGDPDSKLTQGALQGVVVMAVIVYGLLMGMGGILLSWILRARRLALAEAQPQGVQ